MPVLVPGQGEGEKEDGTPDHIMFFPVCQRKRTSICRRPQDSLRVAGRIIVTPSICRLRSPSSYVLADKVRQSFASLPWVRYDEIGCKPHPAIHRERIHLVGGRSSQKPIVSTPDSLFVPHKIHSCVDSHGIAAHQFLMLLPGRVFLFAAHLRLKGCKAHTQASQGAFLILFLAALI